MRSRRLPLRRRSVLSPPPSPLPPLTLNPTPHPTLPSAKPPHPHPHPRPTLTLTLTATAHHSPLTSHLSPSTLTRSRLVSQVGGTSGGGAATVPDSPAPTLIGAVGAAAAAGDAVGAAAASSGAAASVAASPVAASPVAASPVAAAAVAAPVATAAVAAATLAQPAAALAASFDPTALAAEPAAAVSTVSAAAALAQQPAAALAAAALAQEARGRGVGTTGGAGDHHSAPPQPHRRSSTTPSAAPHRLVGSRVMLRGLTRVTALNGRVGRATEWDESRGRMSVQLDFTTDDGEAHDSINVLHSNLAKAPLSPPASGGAPRASEAPTPPCSGDDSDDDEMPRGEVCISSDDETPPAEAPPARAPAARRRTPHTPWATPCSGGCGDKACDATAGKTVTVSVEKAKAALQLAVERGTLAGMQIGAERAGFEFAKAAEAAVAAVVAEKEEEKAAAMANLAATKEAEKEAVVATLTVEIGELEEIVADVTVSTVAAELALQARISSLEQQLGGTNWLSARSKVASAQSEVRSLKVLSDADRAKLKELNDLLKVGPRLAAKGDQLLGQLGSEGAARAAMLLDELVAPPPESANDVGLTDRRVEQLVAHIEQQLFAAGAGQVARTKLLIAALLKRPAVQRLLTRHDSRAERLARTAVQMIDHAKGVLQQLTTARRGSRSLADHQRFETIVAALVPDNATEDGMMTAIGELLGIHWEQIDRAQKRQLLNDGSAGGFSRATKISRKQRKDHRGWGRRVAIDYWHKATRLDTNPSKKRRNREVNPVTQEVSCAVPPLSRAAPPLNRTAALTNLANLTNLTNLTYRCSTESTGATYSTTPTSRSPQTSLSALTISST